eukprot:Nk52_evm94s1073 gene=Nk52_evmTU94s1073
MEAVLLLAPVCLLWRSHPEHFYFNYFDFPVSSHIDYYLSLPPVIWICIAALPILLLFVLRDDQFLRVATTVFFLSSFRFSTAQGASLHVTIPAHKIWGSYLALIILALMNTPTLALHILLIGSLELHGSLISDSLVVIYAFLIVIFRYHMLFNDFVLDFKRVWVIFLFMLVTEILETETTGSTINMTLLGLKCMWLTVYFCTGCVLRGRKMRLSFSDDESVVISSFVTAIVTMAVLPYTKYSGVLNISDTEWTVLVLIGGMLFLCVSTSPILLFLSKFSRQTRKPIASNFEEETKRKLASLVFCSLLILNVILLFAPWLQSIYSYKQKHPAVFVLDSILLPDSLYKDFIVGYHSSMDGIKTLSMYVVDSSIWYTNTRVKLLGYWGFITSVTIAAMAMVGKPNSKAGLLCARKVFHFLIVAIVLPGIWYEPEFTKLSLGIALALFLLSEYVRIFDIYPFSDSIATYVDKFIDEKDQGPIVLTHIYLLLAVALPIWFYRAQEVGSYGKWVSWCYPFVPFAGVLSIGIGDAVASIFGSRYGIARWPNTRKTYLGTFAGFWSQVVFCLGVFYASSSLRPTDFAMGNPSFWEYVDLTRDSMRTLYKQQAHISVKDIYQALPFQEMPFLLVLAWTSLLETFTTNIDNLLLPMFTYALLLVCGHQM